ncbi:MAG: zinc ABC transporter substrate-binding protein [Anaerolineae bacterium]|nr:zinc ABC transporter substrate-binding protein [Anaerolineae bacterium]
MKRMVWFIVFFAALLAPAGCQTSPEVHVDAMPALSAATLDAGERLRVVATTTIVGDVVQNVGGEAIDLLVLIPLGADPHAYEPTPQVAVALSEAHVVFANGAGLEAFLEPLLENAGAEVPLVPLSYNLDLRVLEDEHEEEEAGHDHGTVDPHVWFDPHNIIAWTRTIEAALTTLDPANGPVYAANAEAYVAALDALDGWVVEQVSQVPEEHRRLVTDHNVLAYFAARYGFEPVGTVVSGFSTLAEPSAQERAALEDRIRTLGVPAVFVSVTVNPDLAQQIAADTGVALVPIYTGSLTPAGGPADSYLNLMRIDVLAIVDALK